MDGLCLELSPITESSSDTELRRSWPASSPRKLVSLSDRPTTAECVTPGASVPGQAVSSKRAFFEAMICSSAGVKVSSKGPQLDRHSLAAPEDLDEDASEDIHLTIRVPRPRPAVVTSTDHAAVLAELAQLREQLAQKEARELASAQTLRRMDHENTNLRSIVKELSENRAKLAATKSAQSERLEDLQREYHRVVRLADLSRSVSKENMDKSQQAQRHLASVREELGRHKQVVAFLKQEYTRAQAANADLQRRLTVLERLPMLSYTAPSACAVEFTNSCCLETY